MPARSQQPRSQARAKPEYNARFLNFAIPIQQGSTELSLPEALMVENQALRQSVLSQLQAGNTPRSAPNPMAYHPFFNNRPNTDVDEARSTSPIFHSFDNLPRRTQLPINMLSDRTEVQLERPPSLQNSPNLSSKDLSTDPQTIPNIFEDGINGPAQTAQKRVFMRLLSDMDISDIPSFLSIDPNLLTLLNLSPTSAALSAHLQTRQSLAHLYDRLAWVCAHRTNAICPAQKSSFSVTSMAVYGPEISERGGVEMACGCLDNGARVFEFQGGEFRSKLLIDKFGSSVSAVAALEGADGVLVDLVQEMFPPGEKARGRWIGKKLENIENFPKPAHVANPEIPGVKAKPGSERVLALGTQHGQVYLLVDRSIIALGCFRSPIMDLRFNQALGQKVPWLYVNTGSSVDIVPVGHSTFPLETLGFLTGDQLLSHSKDEKKKESELADPISLVSPIASIVDEYDLSCMDVEGTRVATGIAGCDAHVRLWDVVQGSSVATYGTFLGTLALKMETFPRERIIVGTGDGNYGYSGSICILDPREFLRKPAQRFHHDHTTLIDQRMGGVYSVARADELIAGGTGNGFVYLFDERNGERPLSFFRLDTKARKKAMITDLEFFRADNGRVLMALGSSARDIGLQVVDPRRDHVQHVLQGRVGNLARQEWLHEPWEKEDEQTNE